jgi:hypothetical protein
LPCPNADCEAIGQEGESKPSPYERRRRATIQQRRS